MRPFVPLHWSEGAAWAGIAAAGAVMLWRLWHVDHLPSWLRWLASPDELEVWPWPSEAEHAARMREDAINRLAIGLDVPREIIEHPHPVSTWAEAMRAEFVHAAERRYKVSSLIVPPADVVRPGDRPRPAMIEFDGYLSPADVEDMRRRWGAPRLYDWATQPELGLV